MAETRWRVWRKNTGRNGEKCIDANILTLRWLPGEVQVDFGEADFRVRGEVARGKCPTVAFPHSDVGLTQVFRGEAAECVCQGLRNVFEFVGGVPRRAVFDNATEVGRRVGGEVRTSELFRRFAAHYGLDYTFTNPYSGNEKGNVENKVGCHRRSLFVPVPSFHDARAFSLCFVKHFFHKKSRAVSLVIIEIFHRSSRCPGVSCARFSPPAGRLALPA